MTVATEDLAGWLTRHDQRVTPPLVARRVGAGQSNVTFLVGDAAGHEWVLRAPPPGSAVHDVAREGRIVAALAGTGVPVPGIVGIDADAGGVEGPFVVMHRAPGAPLETEEDAAALSPAERAGVAADVVAILAALHGPAPADVGLGDLGRGDGHLERQIRRITRNWDAWGEPGPTDAAWRACLRSLERGMPTAQKIAVVHGDYRLSNLLIDRGRIGAVLDWELCTLGDPLVDLAWLIDDWRSPADPAIAVPSPTRAGGFPDRRVLVDDYARRTGLDTSELDRYRAFTHWRAATLLQGVLVRRRGGDLGDHGALAPTELERTIRHLLEHALTLA